MSVITYVGSGAFTHATSGNAAPAISTSSIGGDFTLVHVISGDAVAHTATAGWNKIIDIQNGALLHNTVWYKTMVGGDGAPTITHTAGSSISARAHTFRNVYMIGQVLSQVNVSGSTSTAPNLTPLKTASAVLCFFSSENADTSTNNPYTAGPSGYTNVSLTTDFNGDGTTEIGFMMSYKILTDKTAQASLTATQTAAGINNGISVELFSSPYRNVLQAQALRPRIFAPGLAR